jgi:tetratricopeptide (TPR) repeat protein
MFEATGDLRGKSGALHSLAQIRATYGNLDEATSLYQQSLDIYISLGDLQGESAAIHQMAGLHMKRGDLDKAMQLYKQSLEIKEKLGDMQGNATTLYNMAQIFFIRHDFDNALQLLQQARELFDNIGDQKSKALTLDMIGQVLWANGTHDKAIVSSLSGLMLLAQLKIELQTQQAMASGLIDWRNELGAGKFDILWQKEVGQPVPEWLSQSPQHEQSVTVEQFIARAIQSAREQRPEAEKYFKEAQRLAIDSNAPAELQSLGRVLQRIMVGEKNVDLSTLMGELKEMVEKALEG